MGKRSQGKSSGFTLAELLVVVAIIAVLVAIAIPVFGGALDRARAATCAANRRSLKSELTVEYMLEGSAESVAAVFAADKDSYICPGGGTISYKINADNSITVSCSIHSGNAGAAIVDAFKNSKVPLGEKDRLDSNAIKPSGEKTDKINAIFKKLEEAGVDIEALGAKAWAMVNSGENKDNTQLIWTDQDIKTLKAGTSVRVICYNVNTDSYYVGYSNVQTKTLDGGKTTYNIIAKSAEEKGYGTDASNNRSELYNTYEEAYRAFSKLNA